MVNSPSLVLMTARYVALGSIQSRGATANARSPVGVASGSGHDDDAIDGAAEVLATALVVTVDSATEVSTTSVSPTPTLSVGATTSPVVDASWESETALATPSPRRPTMAPVASLPPILGER